MPTLDAEKEVSDALVQWIEKEHLPLEIRCPSSDTIRLGTNLVRSPDILIANKETGKTLGIEIKAGLRELPIGIYPVLKEMQEQFHKTNGDFIVLSTAPLSGALSSSVTEAGIPFFEIRKPSDVIDVLTPRLKALADEPADSR